MTGWRAIVKAQNAYEAEGAAAGLLGKTREDCPYDINENRDGWNFWVYGCEIARGELAIIESGVVSFCNEVSPEPLDTLPVQEAIRSGAWKPKWVKL